MSPELADRIYQSVLHAVLWGSERAEVFQMLKANDIIGTEAEALYRRAFSERVAFLRGEGVRKAGKGIVVFAGGIILFGIFWYGFGAITRALLVICGLLCLWGAGWFLHGVVSFLGAAEKKGSVAVEV